MGQDTIVRISREAYTLVNEIAQKTQRSISQLVSEAVFRTYMGTDKALEHALDKKVSDIKTETFKTKSDSLHCSICKRQIQKNEIVTVVTITYEDNTLTKLFYCYNCYMSETISDQKLLNLEKRIYELKRVKKLLEKEKERLLEEIHKYDQLIKNITVLNELDVFLRSIDYSKIDDETKRKLYELEKKVTDLYSGTKIIFSTLLKQAEEKPKQFVKRW